MLTVVCWRWAPNGYRHSFSARAVETLRAMVARHYARPHRFVCITDDPSALNCETLPLWDDHATLTNPKGPQFPSCFRRLKMFAMPELGERVVSIDLDVAIVGDLVPLWDRPEPLVCWRPRVKARPLQVNGSMVLFTPGGDLASLWTGFDPVRAARMIREGGFIGSDQGWISHQRRGDFASWTKDDGVLRYGDLRLTPRAPLPADARLVFFTGPRKPWDPKTQNEAPWLAEHWTDRPQRSAA
jgi:hypothetical protein